MDEQALTQATSGDGKNKLPRLTQSSDTVDEKGGESETRNVRGAKGMESLDQEVN